MISRFRAPHCVLCIFRCGLFVWTLVSLSSSLVLVPNVFFLFIYLFIYKSNVSKNTKLEHDFSL